MNPVVITHLNEISDEAARDTLRQCCGSRWWCKLVAAERPFASKQELLAAADHVFDNMPREAWLEAFACHPKIGDMESLKMKFAGNRQWSSGEQSGMAAAEEATIARFAQANEEYEQRFGYIFIVCATGKTAAEMLALLEARLNNDSEKELKIAANEQRKITHLRLEKLTLPS
ncbi:2-oxo-4-hydroxy-4-carboxy-5-ureidoimidazoline decarboxylase [Adhaeretor mobilis]|uniref:2-oxo-4-hydroxy-4-carboxy-5-ureidoimidazoline decarboxylase n=1 Tax=Adhaeretor mobilis TaxID=1930276 RepID=A0A517MQE2_9BACT|nr:2-oxo-4-hydroxy-4-carboxy-5-ureidoimidazoline decarboxylase [Adhaeretor mobilis]QDS97105.1 Uric acid degradation bifunctional protein PucL [Adhaeretor mobilis]